MARILVGFDGSPPSRRALDHAASIATKDDEVLAVAVVPASVRGSSLSSMMPAGLDLPASMNATFEQRARERLDEVLAEHAKRGAPVRGEVRVGEPAPVLLALGDEWPATMIVIGHKAFEGPHLTLGHNADAILRRARIPVTVVP